MQHFITTGFAGLEGMLTQHPQGRFCLGDMVTLADICLLPQVYNARRFKVDLAPFPRIVEVDAACRAIDAFARAAPEKQADAD